jgi:hypothetical protein
MFKVKSYRNTTFVEYILTDIASLYFNYFVLDVLQGRILTPNSQKLGVCDECVIFRSSYRSLLGHLKSIRTRHGGKPLVISPPYIHFRIQMPHYIQ